MVGIPPRAAVPAGLFLGVGAIGVCLGAAPALACFDSVWPMPSTPEGDEMIAPTQEFRFDFAVNGPFTQTRFSAVVADSAVGLLPLEGSDNVLAPAFPFAPGDLVGLVQEDPLCPDCRETVAIFTVGGDEPPLPPAPSVDSIQLVAPWTVEPCYDLFSQEEQGSQWLHVATGGEEDLDHLRLEIDLAYTDLEVGLRRLVSARPPTAETRPGPGGLVPGVTATPGTDVEVRLRYVNGAGVAGPEEVATWTVPFAGCGFAPSPPQETEPLRPGGAPPGEPVARGAAFVQAPLVLFALLGLWRARRLGTP